MTNHVKVQKKIHSFKKQIIVPGDKSLSIRWVLFSSLATGISKAENLLLSEDVIAAVNAIKKLGIRVNIKNKICKIYGRGIEGYKFKKNITIDAKNSGTLGRLILGILIKTPYPIKLIGDQSLSKRDFKRVTDPLSKFGVKFELKNGNNLPLKILGIKKPSPILYEEKRGSAQCKSSVIFAAMKTKGRTIIKAKNPETIQSF
jgi:3-phosphoshikimate 1-carboxyvinyltransferase